MLMIESDRILLSENGSFCNMFRSQVKNSTVVRLINGLVIVFLVLMAIAFATLPLLVNKYVEMTGMDLAHLFWIKLFLYITAIPFTILLVMAKKLCNS
jgi:magnesium-transporting ATPase (P-type)